MDSPVPQDPYQALGVPKDASLSTIRSTYLKLVLTCHPDKVYDESVKAQKADQFHRVQTAYEILSDDQKRRAYDARVRLADLRKETLYSPRMPPVRSDHAFSPRPPPTSFERRDVAYEDRAPRRARDEDYLPHRHDEPPPSAKRYEDRYATPKTRRSSAHLSEEKRRDREYEEEEARIRRVAKREQERVAAERLSHAANKKVRDKGRRQDAYTKRFQQARVDDTDSESDGAERYVSGRRAGEPRGKHEEVRRSRRDEPRRSRHDDSDYSGDHETATRYRMQTQDAVEHILKSSGKSLGETDDRRRPGVTRIHTPNNRVPPPPPPPPSPPDVRRSAASRPRAASLSKQRTPEIVEPRYEARRPSLSSSTSAPSGIKLPPGLRGLGRAATMEVWPSEPKQPAFRRTQTSPLGPKSSKLRSADVHGPDHPGPATPGLHPSPGSPFVTRYKYYSDDEDATAAPRIVAVEPSHLRDRDGSPRDRGPLSARSAQSPRAPPVRSHPMKAEPATPRLNRGSSERPRPLFGEVFYSKVYKASDIQYSPRRGSADDHRPPDDHRHAYAYEERRGSAGMGVRSPPYGRQDTVC